MRKSILAAVLVMTAAAPLFPARAAESATRLDELGSEVGRQSEMLRQQQQNIDSLQQELARLKGAAAQAAPPGSPPPAGVSGFFGASALTNPNISLVLDTFVRGSNLSDEELAARTIPGYTSNGLESQRGFNLRAAELFFFAPVDPYVNLYVNLPVSEDGVELEEAYAVTTALPGGLQVKGGKFKSNFSRLDAQHPHAWDFFDIPLVYRAFLGDEGLGGEKGLQLTWLPAWPIYAQFGGEVLQGENPLLFGADGGSGTHAYSLFVKSSIDTSDNATLYFGPSVLFGKADSIVEESEFIGESALYGLEAVWKWKRQSQGLILQAEYLYLNQHGDLLELATDAVESLRRHQDGFYVQGIYQLDRWRFGARYCRMELFADTFEQAGMRQDLGETPWRATGDIEFNPSEFSRIRLQYNHDRSARDEQSNDEVILQFLFSIGAHAAHTF